MPLLLETGGVDATHEGKALAYSPAATVDGAGGREMEEEMRREEKHLRESWPPLVLLSLSWSYSSVD